jgi:hypothetical protein
MYILFSGIILLLIILLVRRKRKIQKRIIENIESVTTLHRGTPSERYAIADLVSAGFNPKAIFHDLYFGIDRNKFTQVDLIVATKVGIIVIEIKDYGGWIFGNGYQKYWTQVLAFGHEKHRFYNPIMQNASHINGIRQQLVQFQTIPFFSIIAFDGDCRLRDISNIPPNTFVIYKEQLTQVIHNIISHNEPAPYTNKQAILNLFKAATESGLNEYIIQTHIDNLRKQHPYKSNHHKYYY